MSVVSRLCVVLENDRDIAGVRPLFEYQKKKNDIVHGQWTPHVIFFPGAPLFELEGKQKEKHDIIGILTNAIRGSNVV